MQFVQGEMYEAVGLEAVMTEVLLGRSIEQEGGPCVTEVEHGTGGDGG